MARKLPDQYDKKGQQPMAFAGPKPDSLGHETRERLIAAAVAIAEEEGLASVGLREVARRSGLTHSAPYRHFRDRRDLIAAAAERGFRELLDACLERQRRGPDDYLSRFSALGIGYFVFAVTRPGLFRLMFSPEASRDERVRPSEGAVFSLCVGAIAAAQGAGLIVPGDPQRHALAAWSSMHGLALLHLDGLTAWVGLDRDPEALAHDVASRVFFGFAAAGLSPRSASRRGGPSPSR